MNPSLVLSTILFGTTISLVQSAPVTAQSASGIQQLAAGFTVLVDGVNPGSGAIVGHTGDRYYVLTANHVVATEDGYAIVTSTGDRYPVAYGQIVRIPGADLAVVPFTSQRAYPVARLANYAYSANFKTVYIAGWAANRMQRFTSGILGDRDFSIALTQGLQKDGYTLYYSNFTEPGMSGSPVLDAGGRVIGIHGLADGEEVNDGRRGVARIKRGFSSGIPISTFLQRLRQTSLAFSPQVEFTPPTQTAIVQPGTENPLPLSADASAVDWVNRGNQLYRLGQFQEALAALNRAVKISPEFHPAWYERGNVLFAMNRPLDALESYDRTIQIKPDLYGVWRDRGVLLAALNKYMAALGSFDKATELKPDDYVLWYMRGNLLNKNLHEYNAAITSYERALQINPSFADAWMGRGRALHEQSQYEAALTAYDKALQLDPNLSVAWILEAETLDRLGRRQAAIAALQQALTLKPNDPEALRVLARLQS